jgi:hypothetical protein
MITALLRAIVTDHTTSATTAAVFGVVGVMWIATALFDVPLRFPNNAQPLTVVAAVSAISTFGVSGLSVEDVLYKQRALVSGLAALLVYAAMLTLAPWLIASASALLGAAGIGVLLSTSNDRVPPSNRIVIIGVACVIARGVAFFATTFWRGV